MRSYIDYLLYRLRIKKWNTLLLMTIISMLFIFSIIALVKDIPFIKGSKISTIIWWLLSFLSIIIPVITKFVQIENISRKFKKTELVFDCPDFMEIKPGNKEKSLNFSSSKIKIDIHDSEIVFYSKELNSHFSSGNDFSIKISNNKIFKIRNHIRQNSNELFPFLDYKLVDSKSQDKIFVNEKKLCLSSDIDINIPEVICHKGTYFDSIITNESYGRFLRSTENYTAIVANARGLFPIKKSNGNTYMQEISTSTINNHIGISTIAFTSDNYILLWVQNSRALISKHLAVPTGSGSVDYGDLDKKLSLKKTITNAMERELLEESSLINKKKQYQINCETIIIGFFRWIKRCGKPEFSGITKINTTYDSFNANNSEISHEYLNFHVTNLGELIAFISTIKMNHSKELSLSLLMNLNFLEDLCNTEKGKNILDIFLFKKKTIKHNCD